MAVAGAAAVCFATASGHAQQQQQPPPDANQPASTAQPPQQPPIFRAGINFVRVDVIVSDKNGNPVGDLKPEDFEITEQNRPQAIETFKLISLDGGVSTPEPPREIRTDLDEETEAAREDVRLFAIFLDDYHVRRETSMAARTQLARFVDTELGPSDMIGLMYPLESTSAVRMTRNHDAVSRGIQQFLGRKYDYTPRNQMEERYANYPAETVEIIRNQVSMSAIKALITRLGGLKEGRKALILVSEGYSNIIPPQLRDPVASLPGIGNPNQGNPNAGLNDINESRAAFSANMDMQQELREIATLANRNNTAIYTVDPRGLATNEFGIDQNVGTSIDRQYLNNSLETLRAMALDTDGRAIVNRNDLVTGMKQIVRDTSAYYLLGYNSTFTATDGKFHEIKVRVKRPGIQVRTRKGYWAFTADDAARALAPPKPPTPKAYETALAAIRQPSRSRIVRTWVGTEPAANGKTAVTFVWEPAPRVAGAAARPTDTPARVALTALGPDGSPYFRGRVPENPAATPGASKVSFEAPPGKVQLRISVESVDADVIDSETREITLPDFTASQAALGTPLVFRARTVRDDQQNRTDPRATPTASREFSRTERVFIRVLPGGVAPRVLTAKLLNQSGQAMSALTARESSGIPGAQEFDLTLASLSPGDYLVEITAAGNPTPATEVVGFHVTS